MSARVENPLQWNTFDKTTAWVRPTGFPSNSVKEEFAEVAIANVDSFKPDATRIAMKESEHQSDKDARVHYTAYGLNNEGKVIDVQHLVKDKK